MKVAPGETAFEMDSEETGLRVEVQMPETLIARVRQGDAVSVAFPARQGGSDAGERRYPAVINGSRKRRIAAGSGVQVQDVNRLLKQHLQMSKMMKKMGKGKMAKMMRGMRGQLPPGFG